MNKRFAGFILILTVFCLSCSKDKEISAEKTVKPDTAYIADYLVANEQVLRAIPKEYIDKARTTLHIAYQHTSHGTHVAYGLYGLPNYKTGDNTFFAVTDNGMPVTGKLDLHDCVIASYAVSGKSALDLSVDETAFIQATRNYLDDPANADVNVIMWSWCSITGHNVTGNYLPGMQTLISEYGKGGSKIGTGTGKRANAVTFIFMTGHAEAGSNLGEGQPKKQSDLITSFCKQQKQFCLDYYSIDTHDMAGNYWDDAGDDGNSAKGGDFYLNWQASHQKGSDWFENRVSPEGYVTYGQHNSQHITSNRKAFAMWWILARIAGWDGGNK